MNKKKHRFQSISFGTGIGSASILVIFVILCLISFATLSIVSANADYKLSTKVLDRTTAYYEAAGKAEVILAKLDQTLSEIYASCESEEAYFTTVGHDKSFVVPLSESQTLEVCVSILYPQTDDAPFYQIKRFQVIPTETFDYDSTLDVMK